MSDRPNSQQIDEQAAAWVARCDRSELDAAERRGLEAWVAADPRAAGALLRAQALFEGVDAAVADAEAGEAERCGLQPLHRPISRRTLVRWTAAAASVAGAGLLLPLIGSGKAYATQVGEVMRVPLDRGASLTMNTDSRVRITRRAEKQLIAIERGEVYFAITPAAAGRTEIHIDGRIVRPSTSNFAIRRLKSAETVVTVKQGQVKIGERMGLQPNSRARLSETGVQVSDIQAREIDRGLMWLQGKLVFEGETLAEAAADFARYGGSAIVIPEQALAAEPVTGLFAANDPEGFAQAAALSLGVRVHTEDARLTIFR